MADDSWVRVTAGEHPFPDRVRRFRLQVVEGADQGRSIASATDRAGIGAHPSNELVLSDPGVSRFHCAVRVDADGPLLVDHDSKNGTWVDGHRVREIYLRDRSLIRLGRTAVQLQVEGELNRIELSDATEFGGLSGAGPALRAAFALLERAAGCDVTVLLEGETGTGKGAAAEAIHRESARKAGPFVVVDASAIPSTLLESELFGHEKGAFTGAQRRRIGAFEEASGGTVFIDEIGELGTDLQPKLLRVLENRTIRRLGSNTHIPIDVRVIAATNRDLCNEVNAGRFRPDLYFRLAVLRVAMPPLRSRPEDLPALARAILSNLGADAGELERLCTPELHERLRRAAWPGNVRELRNYLERCRVFEQALPTAEVSPAAHAGVAVDASRPFADERKRVLDEFERNYVRALYQRHDNKTMAAARAAGLNRVYLHRLARRHGVR